MPGRSRQCTGVSERSLRSNLRCVGAGLLLDLDLPTFHTWEPCLASYSMNGDFDECMRQREVEGGKSPARLMAEECGSTASATGAAPPPQGAPAKGQTLAPQTKGGVTHLREAIGGKAWMHTCLDQYEANKTTGGNGGIAWIQKSGGYYRESTSD